MRDYFYSLFDALEKELQEGQHLIFNYRGENSDFIRFNRNKIRQPGSVIQHGITLELVMGERHQRSSVTLLTQFDSDLANLRHQLEIMQKTITLLPADPYLNLSAVANSSQRIADDQLPESAIILECLQQQAESLDVVGILAQGGIESGYADSFGSRHWHSVHRYDLDWSIHLDNGRAIKNSDSGQSFNEAQLCSKIKRDISVLDLLKRQEVDPGPGAYRAYLCPAALQELISMLGWGDFGARSQRTRQSALLPLIDGEKSWHPGISVSEDCGSGTAPAFTAAGFFCDQPVSLISQGEFSEPLISARSAKEYDLETNAATESPQTLVMAAGDLAAADILQALDTGLYLTNLWYCNYSDRTWARITGMTRYACLWVERGKIVGPLAAMRFDVSLHELFANGLKSLSQGRELLCDNSSYHQRSLASSCLPGMLVDKFTLTL